jgi:RimJ/RimL family protein N-acetyltransferase
MSVLRYFKKIIGERVYLSPVNEGDAEIYTKWLNDNEVSRDLGNYNRLISLKNEREILMRMASEGHNYAIVLIDGDKLIGNVGLLEIDYINRRATVGLFIGDVENRGRGLGTEALSLMVDYGFKTLNFRNIMLTVHSDNEKGIACYKKVGFREFGRRREAEFKNGRYFDLVYMDILDTDFYGVE